MLAFVQHVVSIKQTRGLRLFRATREVSRRQAEPPNIGVQAGLPVNAPRVALRYTSHMDKRL